MNICIYGSASNEIDKNYIARTEELGTELAKRGHSLIFGGGASGLMGAAARGFYSQGAKITGVAPEFFNVDGILFSHCTEMIRTETMRTRKQKMDDLSDAFITTPGGIGTYEEFFEVFTLKQLGRHSKAIAVFNPYGYYDRMLDMLSYTVDEDFMHRSSMELISVFDSAPELLDYLESYKGKKADPAEIRYNLKNEGE